MNKVCLLLGSNEGDRQQWLQRGTARIGADCGEVLLQSLLYETAAWGVEDQPGFLNLAVAIETQLQPLELLNAIRVIEHDLGRQRTVKWGQRTLDIDIIFYNDDIVDLPELTIPHPHIQDRRFALVPLAEIAGGHIHPVFKKTVSDLLLVCPDPLAVSVYKD